MKLFVTAEDLERNAKKVQKISSILDHLNEVIPWESFRFTMFSLKWCHFGRFCIESISKY